MKKGAVYVSHSNVSVSGPELRCCIDTSQIAPSPNMWSKESKSVIYNINSAAPCCELNCSQMLSFETPRGLLSLFLWSICCWGDTAAGLPSSSLAPVCFACVCLTQHSRSGIMAWWQERLNSCGGISFHFAHTNSLQLTVGWCLQWDPGLHLKHIVSQCGGGDPRQWKTLFTDGPLKKPTAAKHCSRWAVWDVEAIMGFNCLPYGHCSDLEACGQISLSDFLLSYFYASFSFFYVHILSSKL